MYNIVELYDQLPKYLRARKGKTEEVFRLVIIKNEWDKHEDACIARYAKELKKGFSNNTILEVKGRNLAEAIEKMYDKYMELKPKYIKGGFFLFKEYLFDKTHRTEILDGKKYIFRTK